MPDIFDQPIPKQTATDPNKTPGAPRAISEVSPGDEQTSPLEPAYKPFDQESALRGSRYQPYSEKPGLHEPPYEPYKGM